MPFLEEVLEALKEKYEEPKESKVKQVSQWVGSKIKCKAGAEENEVPGNEESKEEARKETEDELVKSIEKVEEVLVEFSEKFAGENQAETHQVVIAEMGDIKEKIIDLREEIEGVKKTTLPLWDKPNEDGDTPLHLSVSKEKPKATSLLLKFGADPNIQDPKGQTPLHLACQLKDLQQATKLVAHKAKMIPDQKSQTPAVENLLDNNQDTTKVKQFMSEVYKSGEKLKITKRILEQRLFLFQIVEKPELVAAILDRDEADPELEELINVQEPKRKLTALHLAVEKNSLASSSSILKAANYKLKLDGEGLPPALERLFQEGTVSEITGSLVRGLVEKIRMKSLHPDEALRCLRLEQESGLPILNLGDSNCWSLLTAQEGFGVKIAEFAPSMGVELVEWLVVRTKEEDWDRMEVYDRLTMVNKEGKTALSRVGMQRWSEASMWERS